MATTMEYTDFKTIYRPGTTLGYSQAVVNDLVTAGSYKSAVYSSSPA
jgi:hypothetical protein